MPAGGHNKKQFTEKDIEEMGRMAGMGMSNRQIASVKGIGHATFERHMASNEAFAEAILKGKSKIAHDVMKCAYEQAVSGKNTAMTIFWLKTRQGWKEEQAVTHNILDLSRYSNKSDETLEKIVASYDDADVER